MKLKDIATGESGRLILLVKKIEERVSRNGRKFSDLTVSDGEETASVKYWQSEKLPFNENTLIEADVSAVAYSGGRGYDITSFSPAPKGTDVHDYIVHAPYNSAPMYRNILTFLHDQISLSGQKKKEGCESLDVLVEHIYNANESKLMAWADTERSHHDYYGGLLYHTWVMVHAADAIYKVYKEVNVYDIDPEILLCAAALHDIGKLESLSTDGLGTVEYTVAGFAVGETVLGIEMVRKAVDDDKKAGVMYDADKIEMLIHCLASHNTDHGYGAVKPMTPEAMILREVDAIDIDLETYREETKGLKRGEMSEWIPALSSRVYKE